MLPCGRGTYGKRRGLGSSHECTPTDAGFYATAAASEPNPLATSGSDRRVARGGCFFNHANLCRSSERGPVLPDTRISHVGFRVAARLSSD